MIPQLLVEGDAGRLPCAASRDGKDLGQEHNMSGHLPSGPCC